MSEESLHEILGDIERSVRDFTSAEAVLAEAEQRRDRTRQDVLEQVKRLRAEVDAVHAPELIELLRHLYWQQPGIHGRPSPRPPDSTSTTCSKRAWARPSTTRSTPTARSAC
ncbi:hypothetical protein [Streptomyces erythrochromogenes]|uniref:hypothetical protein n=1 Tax=Streptomyces erythrochromogenes TaxID=285574 RepID=UPI00367F3C90